MLRIESPPSSKKLSSTPTRATPSTSPNTRASTTSPGVRGARYSFPDLTSGAGSASKSSFPFSVNGTSSMATNTEGTMNSGSTRAVCRRSSSVDGTWAPSPATT